MPTTRNIKNNFSLFYQNPLKNYIRGFFYVNIFMENNTSQLTINDIAIARDVIDIAFKRGAFGAAEAKQVGTLFEKIDLFIKTAVAQAEEAAAAETQPQAGVPDSTESTTP
jgi:hypothetical protein